MKKLFLSTLLLALPLLACAYDIAVENADGVTIYYKYYNDGTELEVTFDKDYATYSGDITIPEDVTYKGRNRKVTSIGDFAFYDSSELYSVQIPNTITNIGDAAFCNCYKLSSIIIPNSVINIGSVAFRDCRNLSSITIGNSVNKILSNAFEKCTGLTSVILPNSLEYLGINAFSGCSNLTTVTLGNALTLIERGVFENCDNILTIISRMKKPCKIDEGCFSNDVYFNAYVYVPQGTVDAYKETKFWNKFVFFKEGEPTTAKCATPSISYANKKLTFSCATEGVEYHYTITDADIKSAVANSIDLSATYEISVYATKSGYTNSDVATATLVWTDAVFTETTPSTSSAKAIAESIPMLISAQNGTITVRGEQNGHPLTVYTADGKLLGSATMKDGQASISTNLQRGEIAIVKVGSKSVKIIM